MKNLIVFAVCCVVATLALTDEQQQKLKKHQTECFTETKVDQALVAKLKGGDWNQNDANLKKYVGCMLKKGELMTKEGAFRKDIALAKVPVAERPAVEKMIDACMALKGVTPDESAWNYAKCYFQKNPKQPLL